MSDKADRQNSSTEFFKELDTLSALKKAKYVIENLLSETQSDTENNRSDADQEASPSGNDTFVMKDDKQTYLIKLETFIKSLHGNDPSSSTGISHQRRASEVDDILDETKKENMDNVQQQIAKYGPKYESRLHELQVGSIEISQKKLLYFKIN